MDVTCIFGLKDGRRVSINHLPNNTGSFGPFSIKGYSLKHMI